MRVKVLHARQLPHVSDQPVHMSVTDWPPASSGRRENPSGVARLQPPAPECPLRFPVNEYGTHPSALAREAKPPAIVLDVSPLQQPGLGLSETRVEQHLHEHVLYSAQRIGR